MPLSTIRSTAGFTQAVYDGIKSAAAAGQFTNFNFSSCGNSGTSLKPALLSVAGGIGLKLAAATGPAAPFVAVGAGLLQLFGALFGAHAGKVAKEQQVECAAVPAANDALQAIDQAVQNGTITPASAISGLQNLLAQFTQQVSSIVQMSSSQCNAGCVWTKTLQAIVAEKISQYQDLQTQQQAQQQANPVSSALAPIASAITTAGLPSWVLPAAIGFVIYKLV